MEFNQVFLCKPVEKDKTFTDLVLPPTLVMVSETQADGTCAVVVKDLNSVSDGLHSLDYDDFKIQKMLESGVSYKAIQISSDYRLGNDDEINAFNEKLASIADKLFNPDTSE